MNSRERVLTVFEHDLPDRVPCWCGASVEFWAKAKKELNLDDEGLRVRFRDDFRRVFAEYAGPTFPLERGLFLAGRVYSQMQTTLTMELLQLV